MLAHTLRQAFVLLIRDRRFTLAAVLTLALGVGANAAVFSVIEAGFRADHVLAVGFSLPLDRYLNEEAGRAFFDRAIAALRAVPQVEEAGAAIVTPLTGNNWTVPFDRADRPLPNGGYFTALRIPLLSGRLFDARDRPRQADRRHRQRSG